MALPLLVGEAECGPVNPLQGLSKRFDQDRGVQQDQFGIGRAGPSRQTFRTQQAAPIVDQDAARFFSASPPLPLTTSRAFDFSAVGSSLPAIHAQKDNHQQPSVLSGWAADFMLQQPTASSASHEQVAAISPSSQRSSTPHLHYSLPWNSAAAHGPAQRPAFLPQLSMNISNPQSAMHDTQLSWEKEFESQEQLHVQEDQFRQLQGEQDELARTAGMLLETVQGEHNPKFQNSQFMGLMRQLRDRTIVVDGNQMVENDGSYAPTTYSTPSASLKGKGKAVEQLPMGQIASASRTRENLNAIDQLDINDAYFKQENAEYSQFWSNVQATRPNQVAANPTWDRLQNDWDRLEAEASAIRPLNNYQFQENNPYLVGDSTRTRNHRMHSDERLSVFESVLELEAAVQRDITNAKAWYELGVKQQENEREQKALQALGRAVELDPGHIESWLALAISQTNDGNRGGTYSAVWEWVQRNPNPRYASLWKELPRQVDEWTPERCQALVGCLMGMARLDHDAGGIDADVQIALAVLFNSSEDYTKAQDCFRTALAVRPDDWLLYNRVGATMANSGHAEDALQYYYRALEMNPTYIRARFNLGISCISLRRYEEAAQHILDALALQDADSAPDSEKLNDKRGIMSRALWDSLKTACLHIQRLDLAVLCDQKDLQGFRDKFTNLDV
ncbi:TPR-like protein [Guyanagaster necrorhizus]|uniref:TPR-like protein n=1 Tax=Guyanagaster necrorhizus TaxID=856835 RepID=A0A9P8ASM1_9AGAR|nr:TPR-like protein [Guyanagaster necrorhizus MCA 3950]KAG7446285.1 TPR-like protein [Guyanagaster necrorhizus MCA 3950]